MMNTRFSGRKFWEFVEAKAKECLYKKWQTLNSQWYNMLRDINNEQDYPPAKILLEKYIKNKGQQMGWEMINNLNALQDAVFRFHLNVSGPNKLNGVKFVGDAEMIEKGFTEVADR